MAYKLVEVLSCFTAVKHVTVIFSPPGPAKATQNAMDSGGPQNPFTHGFHSVDDLGKFGHLDFRLVGVGKIGFAVPKFLPIRGFIWHVRKQVIAGNARRNLGDNVTRFQPMRAISLTPLRFYIIEFLGECLEFWIRDDIEMFLLVFQELFRIVGNCVAPLKL